MVYIAPRPVQEIDQETMETVSRSCPRSSRHGWKDAATIGLRKNVQPAKASRTIRRRQTFPDLQDPTLNGSAQRNDRCLPRSNAEGIENQPSGFCGDGRLENSPQLSKQQTTQQTITLPPQPRVPKPFNMTIHYHPKTSEGPSDETTHTSNGIEPVGSEKLNVPPPNFELAYAQDFALPTIWRYAEFEGFDDVTNDDVEPPTIKHVGGFSNWKGLSPYDIQELSRIRAAFLQSLENLLGRTIPDACEGAKADYHAGKTIQDGGLETAVRDCYVTLCSKQILSQIMKQLFPVRMIGVDSHLTVRLLRFFLKSIDCLVQGESLSLGETSLHLRVYYDHLSSVNGPVAEIGSVFDMIECKNFQGVISEHEELFVLPQYVTYGNFRSARHPKAIEYFMENQPSWLYWDENLQGFRGVVPFYSKFNVDAHFYRGRYGGNPDTIGVLRLVLRALHSEQTMGSDNAIRFERTVRARINIRVTRAQKWESEFAPPESNGCKNSASTQSFNFTKTNGRRPITEHSQHDANGQSNEAGVWPTKATCNSTEQTYRPSFPASSNACFPEKFDACVWPSSSSGKHGFVVASMDRVQQRDPAFTNIDQVPNPKCARQGAEMKQGEVSDGQYPEGPGSTMYGSEVNQKATYDVDRQNCLLMQQISSKPQKIQYLDGIQLSDGSNFHHPMGYERSAPQSTLRQMSGKFTDHLYYPLRASHLDILEGKTENHERYSSSMASVLDLESQAIFYPPSLEPGSLTVSALTQKRTQYSPESRLILTPPLAHEPDNGPTIPHLFVSMVSSVDQAEGDTRTDVPVAFTENPLTCSLPGADEDHVQNAEPDSTAVRLSFDETIQYQRAIVESLEESTKRKMAAAAFEHEYDDIFLRSTSAMSTDIGECCEEQSAAGVLPEGGDNQG